MNYRYKNIGEATEELKRLLADLKTISKSISANINTVSATNKGLEKTLAIESEIMTAITGEAKLLPTGQQGMMQSFLKIIQFVIVELEADKVTQETIEASQLLYNKIADLSYRFESFCREDEEQFMLFENIRNVLRNIVGIFLGDKFIGFNQLTVPAFHITFDFKTTDREKITNKDLIKEFITNTVNSLGMSILHGPNIMEGAEENPGITGFAVIDFSHIAIHTFVLPHSLENEVFMDIFSCKPYDKEQVIASIHDTFVVEAGTVNHEVLSFGE